ncbi:MAG: tyrosine-type recombinase/integrase [Acidimicrobiales bacterium]
MTPVEQAVAEFLSYLAVRNYSETSLRTYAHSLGLFVAFLSGIGITDPVEVTTEVLEGYPRPLFHHRKRNAEPLSTRTQTHRIQPVRLLFARLLRTGVIDRDPAAMLEKPRPEHRLPPTPLSIEEVEAVLAVPDVTTPFGLRDRAILEVLYSAALRRTELLGLRLEDVDTSRGTLFIRRGKGKKDRYVPVGDRALHWARRYLDEVRSQYITEPDHRMLFIAYTGSPLSADFLSEAVNGYIKAGGSGKVGSCHLLRHTAATLMLEGGADIRFIAEMLGHARLETTQLYTRVSIHQLRSVHAATHPGSTLRRSTF